MDIFKIVAVGIVGTILCIVLKGQRPEFAVLISIVCGVLIFMWVGNLLSKIVLDIISMVNKLNIEFLYIDIIFKVLGISYIAKYASELCRDAGENSIGIKIEFAAKVMIAVISLPVLNAILNLIITII